MVALIEDLEKEGYSRDDIGTTVKRSIVDTCTNKYVAKAKAWRECVEEDLEDAIVKHYEQEKVKGFEGRKYEGPPPETARAAVESELLDLDALDRGREDVELMPLEKDALLEEMGIKKNGRAD
jgi:hypothetical protein